MADPLSSLRQCNINKKEIIECENKVVIGEFAWPKTVNTNYLMWGSGKDGTPKEYYTLECVLFLLKHVTCPHSMYVRQAAAESIPVVRRPDRKDLLAFLNGETASSPSIDKSAPLQPAPQPWPQLKRPGEGGGEAGGGGSVDHHGLDHDYGHAGVGLGPGGTGLRKVPRLHAPPQVQRVKEQLAARLDAPKEASVTLDNIKSLSEAMSVEKIAAIKAKRLAKKRTTIKGSDDVSLAPDVRDLLDFDVDSTKSIVARERQWRTRSSILQSTGKTFAKGIFAILHSIKAREQGRHPQPTPGARPRAPAGVPAPTTGPAAVPRPASALLPQPAVYNRYDQERFLRKKQETEGFKIDTLGTYHGMSLESVTRQDTTQGRAVRRPPGTPGDNGVMVANTSSEGVTPTHSMQEEVTIPQQMRRISRTPIIIIPSGAASLISMYNAKDILQDLRYVATEEKKSGSFKRESELLLQRRKAATTSVGYGLNPNIGDHTVPYRVLDNPRKLSPADWDRVVAVFVMGPAWQFKGWPWDGNPVEIFAKICAFHIKYDEIKLDSNVARWAVHVIELSRTKRYLDRAALKVFWEKLDKHMIKNKPHLRF